MSSPDRRAELANELARRAMAAVERQEHTNLLFERIAEGKVVPFKSPATGEFAIAVIVDSGYDDPPDEALLEYWRQAIHDAWPEPRFKRTAKKPSPGASPA